MSKKISDLVRNTNMYLLGVIIGERRFSVYFNSLRSETSNYLTYYRDKSSEQIASEVDKIYLNGTFQTVMETQAARFENNPEYNPIEFDYESHYDTAVSFLSWVILADDNEISNLEKKVKSAEAQLIRREKKETVPKKEWQEVNQRILEYVKDTYLATN